MSREQDEDSDAVEVATRFALRVGALQRCTLGDLWHGDELPGDDDEDLEELLEHATDDEVEDAGGKKALLSGLRQAIGDAAPEQQCAHPVDDTDDDDS